MAMWFKADEQPIRLVTYYCMNGFAGIFGGLLGYAIGHITSGLQRWQYVFLIFGAISISWAIVFLVFMPDLPSSARFLNAEEKVVAVERVAVNRQGVKNHHFKKYQVWQFIRDPKTWILFIMSVRHPQWSSLVSLLIANYISSDCSSNSECSTEHIHVYHSRKLWLQ